MRLCFSTLALICLLAGCGGADRSDPAAAYRRGVDYYKEGKYAKARDYFQTALAEAEPTAQALNFAGVCELYEGNREQAVNYFEQALALDEEFVPARFNLGLAQLEAGQAGKAIPNLDRVRSAANPPAYVESHLARAYSDKSAWRQAHEALTRHLAAHGRTADGLNTLGVIEVRLGRYNDARKTFSNAIAADPTFAAAYLNRGLIQQDHFRQPQDARRDYERYLELARDDELASGLKRKLETQIQRLAKAAPAKVRRPPPEPTAEPPAPTISRTIPAPPRAPTEPAPAAPRSAAATSETPPPQPRREPPVATAPPKRRTPVAAGSLSAGNRTKAALIYNRGVKAHQREDFAAAIREYQQAAQADPSFAAAYYNLGICYRASRDPVRALESYERALQADPDYKNARFNYAIVLQEQGYRLDAIEQYETLLASHPNEAAVHLSVAKLYAQNRATVANARTHYQAYLRLQPNSPAARDIRRWLERNR